MAQRPIGIYYEHPDWFKPLFAELDRRGVAYERIAAAQHRFDPTGDEDGGWNEVLGMINRFF